MNILITGKGHPNEAATILSDYLKSIRHRVEFGRLPSEHFYIKAWDKYAELRQEIADGNYDIAIATHPQDVLFLKPIRAAGNIGKLIYWRMDYAPKAGSYLPDKLYQWTERRAMDVDEVWSMAKPDDPFVEASLRECDTTVRHVPYMLPHAISLNGTEREKKSIWLGHDRDGSRALSQSCALNEGLEFVVVDFSSLIHSRTADELAHEMNSSAICITPYKPYRASPFRYSDPARIKWALAYGIPVLTTRVPPIHTRISAAEAGLVTEYRARDIREGVVTILEDFEKYSANAHTLAQEFEIGPAWVKIDAA